MQQFALFSGVKILGVFAVLMTCVGLRGLGRTQSRGGHPGSHRPEPRRSVRPAQPACDGIKSFLKEDFTPDHVRKVYFWLATRGGEIPALLTVAVIPFGSTMGKQQNGHRELKRRNSLHVRHRVPRRLRHRAGGLPGEFQVSFPRRHPFQRAAHQYELAMGFPSSRFSCGSAI